MYSQRLKEAYRDVPIIIGGIEAILRRIAHYDYWSDRVKRSVLLDSRADLLVFGNAERAIVDIAHRLANGDKAADLTDIRGTAFVTRHPPANRTLIDSTSVDELVGSRPIQTLSRAWSLSPARRARLKTTISPRPSD